MGALDLFIVIPLTREYVGGGCCSPPKVWLEVFDGPCLKSSVPQTTGENQQYSCCSTVLSYKLPLLTDKQSWFEILLSLHRFSREMGHKWRS